MIIFTIAALTLVSALVHSSTLVIASIYFITYFNEIFMNFKFYGYLLLTSCLTVFISGLNALFEFDLKKIIGFLILCLFSFIFMILCLGKSNVCFFYLLMYASFKSIIFLRAGILIFNINNNMILIQIFVK